VTRERVLEHGDGESNHEYSEAEEHRADPAP
jgi:hypothetical protein